MPRYYAFPFNPKLFQLLVSMVTEVFESSTRLALRRLAAVLV